MKQSFKYIIVIFFLEFEILCYIILEEYKIKKKIIYYINYLFKLFKSYHDRKIYIYPKFIYSN